MEQKAKKTIQELINDCPKGRKLSKPERGIPCKAKYIGLESFAECLERQSGVCPFSLSFGNVYYCKCPVGVSILNELKR
jgi:hypothetical protein